MWKVKEEMEDDEAFLKTSDSKFILLSGAKNKRDL